MRKTTLVSLLSCLFLASLGSGCFLKPHAPTDRARASGKPPAEDIGTVEDKDAPFRVAEYGPQGIVPHENLEGGIWVLFNKPVVALKGSEKPALSSPVLRIAPKTEGTYRWYGSRLLCFEPKTVLDPATEYAIQVAAETRSLAGEALGGDTAFLFRTEPLSMLAVTPSGDDVPTVTARRILVEFNFPVDPKTVAASIEVEAGGRHILFRAARPDADILRARGTTEGSDRLLLLELKAEPQRNEDIKVRLLPDARPKPTAYGSEKAQELAFHTLRPFALAESQLSTWTAAPSLLLEFNHPVDKDSIAQGIRFDLAGFDPAQNVEVWENTVVFSKLPVRFESKMKVKLLAGLADLYGSKLGHDEELELEVGPAGSYVNFRHQGDAVLESKFPATAVVETQNALEGSYIMGRLARPFDPVPNAPLSRIDLSKAARNTRHFEYFDFTPLLNEEGKGAVFAYWKFRAPSNWSKDVEDRDARLRLQVTDIGASLHMASNMVLVRAESLSSGQPVADATVTLRAGGAETARGRTDASGIAALRLAAGDLARASGGETKNVEVEIRKGKDVLVLSPASTPALAWNAEEPLHAEEARPRTYLWTDRGIYRPDETVSFGGVDRNLQSGLFTAQTGRFRVELARESDGVLIGSAQATGTSSAEGGFGGQIRLPGDLEPSEYCLLFYRLTPEPVRTGSVYLKVANFRRVAFGVEVSLPAERKTMGDTLEARFSGTYLAGGKVTRGKWNAWWTRREVDYQPPGEAFSGYRFAPATHTWAEELGSGSGDLSGDGTVSFKQPLSDADGGRVYSYRVTATVEDADRQALSAQADAVVFSSDLLVGAKIVAGRAAEDSLYFVRKGETFTLKAAVADPEGRPAAGGELSGTLVREEWKLVRQQGFGQIETRYESEEVKEKTFTMKYSGGFGNIGLAAEKTGSYFIDLSGRDGKGRPISTRFPFYVTGSGETVWQRWDEKVIELVTDKPSYRPGEKVKLLLKSPVKKGKYLITVEREGILEQKTMDLEGSTPVIELEVKESYVPVFYVSVSTSLPRTQAPPSGPDTPDFGKPRGYSGVTAITVDPASRRIDLDIERSADSYRPGAEARLKVKATMNGKPLAGAEIALAVADRGVLDLIGYHVPDPVAYFYDQDNFRDLVAHFESRDLLLDPVTWRVKDLPGGDEKGDEAPSTSYDVRRDFRPTAFFRTGLVTAADGTVDVRFTLPDLLTRFRATAVAVKGDRFGRVESEFAVSNPLTVRAALPRRMRAGDEAQAGVVVTNLDPEGHEVTVSVESGLLTVVGEREKKVKLQTGETTEISFTLKAAGTGTAALTFTVDADVLKEKLEERLTVERSPVREAFTIAGHTRDKVEEALVVPEAFAGDPEEGLTVSMDSTVASALQGAIEFLEAYPYECLEQKTSRLFPRVLFPWLLSGDEKKKTVEQMAEIARFANADGGFSYWDGPSPRVSSYYVTLRTAHLLATAGQMGIPAPAGVDTGAVLSWLAAQYDGQSNYLKSYAVYVWSLYGRKEKARADRLLKDSGKTDVFRLAFLGLAYQNMGNTATAQEVLARLKNLMRVGTRSVTLVGETDDWSWYGGDLQAKALLLMLYSRLLPDSAIAQALATGLLEENRGGYWGNTSNAGWVLQAFAEVMEAGKEADTDFSALTTLGEETLAEKSFRGISRAPYRTAIPAARLSALAGTQPTGGKTLPLVFSKKGQGTLYYSAVLRRYIAAETAEARDEGIGVATDILDESGNPITGTDLKLGKVYRARVTLFSSRDRTFLAVRVPVPSGTDILDGTLAATQIVRAAGEEGDEGEDMRIYDNEVRFHFESFPRGKRTVSFLFRATTPGAFPTPPAQAECMYQPEIFGRAAGTVYRIGK